MRKSFYIIIALLLVFRFNGIAQYLSNPSFEGEGNDNEAPEQWSACALMCSPDNPPLPEIKIYQPASDGDRYLSMRTRGFITVPGWEGFTGVNDDVSTNLIQPLLKGVDYKLLIDLASDKFADLFWIPTKMDSCRLLIWAGTSLCSKEELLFASGPITDTTWKTYEICFTPSNEYYYFYLQADFVNNDTVNAVLLVDNLRLTESTFINKIVLDTTVIPGTTIQLHATDNLSYSWSPSDNLSCDTCQNPILQATNAQNYIVTMETKYGCVDAEQFNIKMPDCETISSVKSGMLMDTTIVCGESIQMSVDEGDQYKWYPADYLNCSDNCQTATSTPENAIEYRCTYVDENNCTIENSFKVDIILKIPNVITPNGDSYNDDFSIGGLPEGSYLKIIDRSGRVIFETNSYNNKWPSSSPGSLIHQTDTYWYTLKCPGVETVQGYVLVKF
jgi:gliding motility-associated-like protein